MENLIFAIIIGLIGVVLGAAIPPIAEKIIENKRAKSDLSYQYNFRLNRLLLQTMLSVLMGGCWFFAAYRAQHWGEALLLSFLFSLAILIGIIDIRIRIIPNELVLAMAAAGIVYQIIYYGFTGLFTAAFSMIVIMVAFTIVASIIGLGTVGAGDVKLVGAMALALGYPSILYALFVMSLTMLIYCILGLLSGKLKKTSMFPFAPFIMLGMIFAILLIFIENY